MTITADDYFDRLDKTVEKLKMSQAYGDTVINCAEIMGLLEKILAQKTRGYDIEAYRKWGE